MTDAHQQREQFLHHFDCKKALQHYSRFMVFVLFNEDGDVEECMCTNAVNSTTSALSTKQLIRAISPEAS